MWSLSSSYNLCRTQQKTVFDRKFFTVKRFEMPTYDRSMIWSHSSIAPKSNSIENSIGTSFTIIQTVFIQGFLARWLFGQNTTRKLKTLISQTSISQTSISKASILKASILKAPILKTSISKTPISQTLISNFDFYLKHMKYFVFILAWKNTQNKFLPVTTVLDSASTQSLRFLGTSVLMRLSLLFSPTRLFTSGTVVVEMECLLVSVELLGLRSDDKEVEVVVVVLTVVADVSEADTVSLAPPFSWTDFFSVAV